MIDVNSISMMPIRKTKLEGKYTKLGEDQSFSTQASLGTLIPLYKQSLEQLTDTLTRKED